MSNRKLPWSILLLVMLFIISGCAVPAAPAPAAESMDDAAESATPSEAAADVPAADSATSGESAADAIKIGFVSTLSGPAAALGVDVRDGFLLAIQHLEADGVIAPGSMAVIVRDDQQAPDVANQAVQELLQNEQVDFMTGIIFSNLMLAVADTIFDAETFYISPNAGPSQLAGEGCNPFFFNVAWQNDNLHEAMGQYVMEQGYQNVYILAPDYPAGHDALTGFKRYYTGGLAEELYTQLGQLDFAVEMELIRASGADAVFTFQPGGMGINFIKQYAEAGLLDEIPLYLPGFSADQDVINAVGEATVGLFNSSQWTLDLENEVNARFVADFESTYERIPTLYASQGYDAAVSIAAAVNQAGDLSDKDAVRTALEAADFASVRGKFAYNTNHYPIQDYYLRQVVQGDNGP
ncbi:MAG TPA: ABC transporter substrate-binding protein, partial [Caldilineaceae bacterium]|nr:ABC transporter substrate-binding protein [Caldilineaceae bacterium]